MTAPRLPLDTDTAHTRLESRQYNVLKWDLGEGVPRASIKAALLVAVPWLLVMWATGVPAYGPGLMLWIGPPAVATWRCMSRDDGGRLRIAGYVDRVLWWARRARPIVNAETARPGDRKTIHPRLAMLHVPVKEPQ